LELKESSWLGVVVLSDDWEGPTKEDSPWGTRQVIWLLCWYVIRCGDDGSEGFWTVFRLSEVEETKYSIKGTGRTCWTELVYCVEGGKMGVGSKQDSIGIHIVLLGFKRVTTISFLKSRIAQEHAFEGSSSKFI